MTTRAGVGFSERPDSLEAAREAATAAVEQLEGGRCDLALVYCTAKHDQALVHKAVRAAVGPRARIVGGCGIGVISTDRLGYEGCQLGVAVLSSDSVEVDVFAQGGLVDNEYEVGRALGAQIGAADYAGPPNVLLMYDAVKRPLAEGLAFNKATTLLEGLGEALGSWPPIAGCGLVGDHHFQPTQQWVDDRLERQTALALVLSGKVRMDTVILHGLRPMSSYHTVTETEGELILGLDGRPTLTVIDELLGPERTRGWEDYPFFLVLGANKGDRFGEFREGDYVNQLCVGIDRTRQAMVMVEPYLKPGDEVQLMRRGIDFGYVRERVDDLRAKVGDRRPFLALYIDCAGRTALSAGTQEEEAAGVQEALGGEVPLLGMYSATEIARVGDEVQAHNWTGVLCMLSE